MERAHARTQRPLHVQRGCERSRLEDDLVASAYQLAAPIRGRSLRPPACSQCFAESPTPIIRRRLFSMTPTNDSFRAAIYARVSSDQQAEAGTIAAARSLPWRNGCNAMA